MDPIFRFTLQGWSFCHCLSRYRYCDSSDVVPLTSDVGHRHSLLRCSIVPLSSTSRVGHSALTLLWLFILRSFSWLPSSRLISDQKKAHKERSRLSLSPITAHIKSSLSSDLFFISQSCGVFHQRCPTFELKINWRDLSDMKRLDGTECFSCCSNDNVSNASGAEGPTSE